MREGGKEMNTKLADKITFGTWREVLSDGKDGLSFGFLLGGILAGVIGGIGLGVALAVLFVGAVWKLIW